MTYEEWWKEFTEMNEEWRYADSEALRKAAFESGAASRDAEIAELVGALEAMLTHMGMDEDEWNKPTFNQARAALAKVRKP